MIEYKDFSGGLKDIDTKGRVVTGYLSSFGNKDFHGDVIEKGAFKKTIAERKEQIFFLNQHDWKMPLNKFNVIQEDEKGLYFESMPLPDTSYANDVIKLYEAGVLKEHSIGFHTLKDEYNENEDTRYIKEVKLFEGSVVTLGANPNTPFTGLKSMTQKEIEDETKKILKAYRNGNFTDETFGLLEIAIKQLQKQSYELGRSLKEPFSDTHIKEPIIETLKEFNNQLIRS